MPDRRMLLRMMLGSLAVGAAAGVGGALLGSYDVVFRIMWTAFFAAVAAECAMLLGLLTVRQWTRPAGLLGMFAVLGVFCLATAAMWNIDRRFTWLEEWEIPALAAWLGVLTPPAVGLTCLLRTGGSKTAGWVGVSTVAAAFALGAAGILVPHHGRQGLDEEFWSSVGAVGGYGLLIAGCLAQWAVLRRPWRWFGVAAAVAGCGVAVYLIWWVPRPAQEPFAKTCAVLGSVAVVTAFANVILLVPLRPAHRWMLWPTIVAAVVTALLIDLLVVYEIGEIDSVLARLTGAAGVLTICGSLAVFVMAVMNRQVQLESGSFVAVDVTIVCPRCRKKQSLPVGDSACTACGLRISLRVEDPRCPHCEYLLYGLTGDTCPECGRVIREAAQGER